MEINIRKALPEDAHDYTDCHISIWQSAYKGIVPDNYLDNMPAEKEQHTKRYKDTLTNPGSCEYFCVMKSERMIGFIITNKSVGENKTNIGEIWAVYLREEFWGTGYGKEMLDFAVYNLICANSDEIFLWVFEDNIRARRFYEKNNFRFDGTQREVDWYGGVPLVQLKYVLTH